MKKKDKVKLFDELLNDMNRCIKCLSITGKNNKDKSLINMYKDIDFAKEVPSIWTDWYNRLDSKIMIIGQDWGPFEDMKKLHQLFLLDKTKENWKNLINSEKSLTKNQLTNFIIESSQGKINSIDNIYITNAIMCARKGNNYRGDNINLKNSAINCKDYLLRQIEIVKPKVILTLGYYPLMSLSKIFNFKIGKDLKETILELPEIIVGNYIIIPLYHPAAQIKKEEQLKQYYRIWNYI